jgi:hypothetical protein
LFFGRLESAVAQLFSLGVIRMAMHKHRVEVRMLSPGDRAQSVQSHFETWFVPDGSDLVFSSALSPELSVSEHLKWFHGMLQFHRKFIRQLEESGIRTVVRISVRERSFTIEPEAVFLAHQLHLTTEIEFRP